MKLVEHEPYRVGVYNCERRAARDRGSLLPRRRAALPRQLGRRDLHRRLPAPRRELRPRAAAARCRCRPTCRCGPSRCGSRTGSSSSRSTAEPSRASFAAGRRPTPDYIRYHDEEWGRPVRDERGIYERLCLEGFQSGLSWLTILRKRPAFREAFAGFDPDRVAAFGDARRRAAARRRRHRPAPREDRGGDRERPRHGRAPRRPASRCTSSSGRTRPRRARRAGVARRLAGHDARVGRAREAAARRRVPLRRPDDGLRRHASMRRRERPSRRLLGARRTSSGSGAADARRPRPRRPAPARGGDRARGRAPRPPVSTSARSRSRRRAARSSSRSASGRPGCEVLEIGGSRGYSTIWLGAAVRMHGGHVTSLEAEPASSSRRRRGTSPTPASRSGSRSSPATPSRASSGSTARTTSSSSTPGRTTTRRSSSSPARGCEAGAVVVADNVVSHARAGRVLGRAAGRSRRSSASPFRSTTASR